MTNAMIEIGDQVRTIKTLKNGKSILLPRGSVGKVYDDLGDTKEGGRFVVEFEGLPFNFNFWQVELELVKKDKSRERKKSPPEPTIHRQRAINLGGVKVEVDVKLAPLIQGLFRAGILTSMSCQENEPGITWLQFINTEHALRFVHAASKVVGFFTWENNAGILMGFEDDSPAVSIRFPLADLKEVKKVFPAG